VESVNVTSALVIYGPLGIGWVILLYAIISQRKERFSIEKERRLLERRMQSILKESGKQQAVLLHQLIAHEQERTEIAKKATDQYVKLNSDLKDALGRLSDQIEKLATDGPWQSCVHRGN